MPTKKASPFDKKPYRPGEWINKEEAAKLLGIKPKSLGNLMWAGKIPDKFVSEGVNGIKFFYRPGLQGFEN